MKSLFFIGSLFFCFFTEANSNLSWQDTVKYINKKVKANPYVNKKGERSYTILNVDKNKMLLKVIAIENNKKTSYSSMYLGDIKNASGSYIRTNGQKVSWYFYIDGEHKKNAEKYARLHFNYNDRIVSDKIDRALKHLAKKLKEVKRPDDGEPF